jgi:hypothetical protein
VDLRDLRVGNALRFANELWAWIDVEDGLIAAQGQAPAADTWAAASSGYAVAQLRGAAGAAMSCISYWWCPLEDSNP